jgi:hypothetical protein
MAGKIRLNLKGFRELRTSPPAAALVEKAARKAQARLGDDWVAEESPGRNRARWTVTPNTAEAALESAREPARLIAALNAARS